MDSKKSSNSAVFEDERSLMIKNPPSTPRPPAPSCQELQPQRYDAVYNAQLDRTGQQPPGQQVLVVFQPTLPITQYTRETTVHSYVCYSTFTTLFCCMPIGLVALIFSCLVLTNIDCGDRRTAKGFSRTAKILNDVALGCGLAIVIINFILAVCLISGLFGY